jgi:hypothetical protein
MRVISATILLVCCKLLVPPLCGAMLTSPCLSWPTTLIPDGSSRPCPSGPKGTSTTPPHTRGPNFQVVLTQVTPKVHVDPLLGYSDYDVFLENDEGSRVYRCKKLL